MKFAGELQNRQRLALVSALAAALLALVGMPAACMKAGNQLAVGQSSLPEKSPSASSTTKSALPPAPADAGLTAVSVEMLREARQRVTLRHTTIEQITPEWSVHIPANLKTWDDAVAYADKELAGKPAARALLLWRFIKEGDQAARLDALQLTELGLHMMQSSGETINFGLDTTFCDFIVHSNGGQIAGHVFVPQAKTTLGYCENYDKPAKVLRMGILHTKLPHTIGGVRFDTMDFDPDSTLGGFTLARQYSDGTLIVGGNTSGTNDTDFYWAQFIPAGGSPRSLKLPPIPGPAAAPPANKLSPADIKRLQQGSLDSPDWKGPLSVMLKVRAQADTWDELAAKLKPTITWGQMSYQAPDCGFPNMMWIDDGPDGKPVFRMAKAFTWKPTGQKTRWVIADLLDVPGDELAWQQVAGNSMPEEIRIVPEKPQGDHPISYAIVKASSPAGGTVYEIGWEEEMSAGSGHYENRRILYVWRDAGGKWRLIGEGDEESTGKMGGGESVASWTDAKVTWHGDPVRPMGSLVNYGWDAESGEEEIGLPDLTVCRDAVLDGAIDALPAAIKWSDQDYIAAVKGDTLATIVYRLAVWRDYGELNLYEEEPDVVLLLRRENIYHALRAKLLRLNPKLAGVGTGEISEGTHVIIATRVSAASP